MCFLAVPLVAASFCAFRAWQLRYSYDAYLSAGRPTKHLLYSSDILEGHKNTVRKWIAEEFLGAENVIDLHYGRTMRQMALLQRFGEHEDMELLWRRAQMGFPIGQVPPTATYPPGQKPESRQLELCNSLALFLRLTSAKVAGGKQAGLRMLKEGFAKRQIAPEVRKAHATLSEHYGLPKLRRRGDGPPE